jgi:hypothetical protein
MNEKSNASSSDVAWSTDNIKLRKISTSYTELGSEDDTADEDKHFNDFFNGNNLLTVTTNIESRQASQSTTDKKKYMHNSSLVGLFKSMIQKGFRRGCAKECAVLGAQLLYEHPEECLRRLPIILIEDGTFHAGFPILVWLMVAMSKGFEPPDFLLATCIQIFTEGASCNVRDHAYSSHRHQEDMIDDDDIIFNVTNNDKHTADKANCNSDVAYSFDHLKQLPACGTLIGCIFLRMAYGGMPGDMRMLYSHAIAWTRRFTANRLETHPTRSVGSEVRQLPLDFGYLHDTYTSELNTLGWGRILLSVSSMELVPLKTFSPLVLADKKDLDSTELMWILSYTQKSLKRCENVKGFYESSPIMLNNHMISEGVDFHCDSKLIDFLLQKLQHDKSEKFMKWKQTSGTDIAGALKTTIWQFRSGVNYRSAWIDVLSLEEKHHYIKNRKEVASVKAQYAELWKIICPLIKVYCVQKLSRIC